MDQLGRYRLVRPDAAMALLGLRVLVGGTAAAEGKGSLRAGTTELDAKVEGFLNYARNNGLDVQRQVLALETVATATGTRERIAGMCLWVPAPGRTAMLFGPSQGEFPDTAAGTEAAVAAALDDARTSGVALVQAMMEPADAGGKTVFASAGLTQLATLTYMERRPPVQPLPFGLPPDFTLLAYEPANHTLFRAAIVDSYAQTLDCPALSGLRDVEDVIEGHKAVGGPGTFDPQLWGVLMKRSATEGSGAGGGVPVGCLLLGVIPARRALELVYLGLAPEVRGQGLGRLLMQRVLAIASRRQLDLATLAVDAANGPAVKLYRRFGYTSVAQRVAMIKKLM